MIRRFILALAVTCLAAGAWAHDGHGVSMSIDDSEGCSRSRVRFNDEPAFVDEEVMQAGNLSSLKVRNSPLTVKGGNSSGYTITVCKAAANAADLNDIHVSIDGGELKSTGPSHKRWTVMYVVQAPRGANLTIEADNGPVSIRDIDATIRADMENGPLSLKNAGGDIDATTTNGPISLSGGYGKVKLTASNGPLSVKLDGAGWRDGSLEASTKNGPLSVKVPRGYGSGVLVESDGHGPVSCQVDECYGTRVRSDRWDERPRRFELGRGPQAVRLSTVNGPLTIKEAD